MNRRSFVTGLAAATLSAPAALKAALSTSTALAGTVTLSSADSLTIGRLQAAIRACDDLCWVSQTGIHILTPEGARQMGEFLPGRVRIDGPVPTSGIFSWAGRSEGWSR